MVLCFVASALSGLLFFVLLCYAFNPIPPLRRAGQSIRKWYRRNVRPDFWFPFFLALCILAVIAITAVCVCLDAKADPPAQTETVTAETSPAQAEPAEEETPLLLEGLFEGLRVFFSVAEGDSADFREYASRNAVLLWFARHISLWIPLLAAATASTFLWHRLPHHVPWFRKVWYIFSELEPNSIRMATSIHENNPDERNVFIFLRTRRGQQEPDQLEGLQELTYFLYPGTETRFLSLPGRKNHILRMFFLSENTDENFSRMKEFLNNAQQKKHFFVWNGAEVEEGRFLRELYLLSETESAPLLIDDLRKQIQEKSKTVFPSTELRLLDRYRAVTYDLLQDKPLYQVGSKDEVNILVLGFGKIGREFFRAVQSVGLQKGRQMNITICDLNISKKMDAYKQQCPEAVDPERVILKDIDAESSELKDLVGKVDFHYILIALGEDERNIRVAFWLKRHYRKKYWENDAPQPQICVNIEDSIKHNYVEVLSKKDKKLFNTPLHVFGGLDQVFTPKVLMPEKLWHAARWLQMQFNKENKIPELWIEYQRRSSLACVLHAPYHVASVIGANAAAPVKCAYENALASMSAEDEKKETEKDKLINSEHDRWMAYVRNEGMQKAEPAWTWKYYPELDDHVDVDGRLSPCLVPAGSLNDIQQMVDTLRGDATKMRFRERDKLAVESAGYITDLIKKDK